MSDYHSTMPQIPFEIAHQILKNVTDDLVEGERRDYTLVGQTNAFLLSASLVSRTWRNIAQPLLLKYGLVDPIGITRFLRELKRTGVLDSLDVVRIGVTQRSRRQFRHTFGREFDKSEAELNTEAINTLLKVVESLRGVEFNGPNLLVDGPLCVRTPRRIESFTSTGRSASYSGVGAFRGCEPFRQVTIIERDKETVPNARDIELLSARTTAEDYQSRLTKVERLHLRSTSWAVHQGVLSCCGSALQTLHLQYDGPPISDEHGIPSSQWIKHPSLSSVTTNLSTARLLFRRLICNIDAVNPTITNVIVLGDPGSQICPEDSLDFLHRLLHLPHLQELELFEGWRSEAMEKACKAREITLTWSRKCTCYS